MTNLENFSNPYYLDMDILGATRMPPVTSQRLDKEKLEKNWSAENSNFLK